MILKMFLLSEAIFIILAVLGVLVTNFQMCLTAAVNADKNVEPQNTNTVNAGTPKICETTECQSIASSILNNMDPSINPCDNFYQFVCGKFISKTVVPKDKSQVVLYDTLHDQIDEQLKDSIEKNLPENSPRTFKILKTVYNSCMDTTRIDAKSEQEMRDILKTLGGWPVMHGELWDESAFDWQKSVAIFRKNGYSYQNFIGFRISRDLKNSSGFVITLDQEIPKILSVEDLSKGLEDTLVQAYLKYMTDLAEIFGVNHDVAKKELTESLNFAIEMAKISLSEADRQDLTKLYNPMTIAELQATYKNVQWHDYMNNMLEPQAKVELGEKVIVAVPSYFQQFSELIVKTPKRVLANYVMGCAIVEAAPTLSERVLKALDEFNNVYYGKSVIRPSRWRTCIDYVTDYISIAANSRYVRDYFDEPSKADAIDVLENLRKSYERLINQVDWMDEETKQTALEKLRNTQATIGYPSEYLNDKKLHEYYQNLEVHPESFLRNDMAVYSFIITKRFEQLRKPFNRNDWETRGLVATAPRYTFEENSILVTAGMLQGQYFNRTRQKYMNYGAIGQVVGNLFTHAFDNRGSQYDKDGNLKDWWQPEMRKKFLEQADCFVRQYNNYEVKQVGMKVNGTRTKDENIADYSGMRAAYLAYKEWEKQNGPEAQLPGLPYSSDQMFWISNAMTRCSKMNDDALTAQINYYEQSPEEFRIIGPASNMPEFADTFKCPAKSWMNPADKCKIW